MQGTARVSEDSPCGAVQWLEGMSKLHGREGQVQHSQNLESLILESGVWRRQPLRAVTHQLSVSEGKFCLLCCPP